MSRRISAKILLSVLVAFSATFFILKLPVKADTVQPYTFLYSTRYTAIQDTGAINERYQLTAEIYISANHEVSGRYVVYFYYDTSSTANMTLAAKNITADGGQIDNVIIDSGVCSFNVLVTGQKDVTVRVTGASNNRTSLFQVDGISFSGTDSNNNPISDTTSMYARVMKIEDTLGLLNNTADSIYAQLHEIQQMQQYNIPLISQPAYWLIKRYGDYILSDTFDDKGIFIQADFDKNVTDTFDGGKSIMIKPQQTVYLVYMVNWWREIFELATSNGILQFTYNNATLMQNSTKLIVQGYTNNTNQDLYVSLTTYQNFTDINILPIYLGTYIPEEISYITGIDINNTYTQNQNTIISKIQELINGNSNTQQSVSNNDQVTNTLQQQTDQYHNIESTFQSSFNTEQTQIKEQLNVNPMTSFSKTALWFTDQLTNLYNRSGNFKILFTLPLILGLAMYFIGRGRKVAAPNTVEHYTLVESGDAGEGRTVYKTTRSTARRRAFRDRSKT